MLLSLNQSQVLVSTYNNTIFDFESFMGTIYNDVLIGD
jgi:hypothetical protein